MQEANPYAPPTVPFVPQPVAAMYRREGNLLVIRDGAVLPNRCILTNQPINERDWTKKRSLTWTPAWVWIFILFGLIIALILALCLQKKAQLTYNICRAKRNRQLRFGAFSLLATFGGIGLMISALSFEQWGNALVISGIVLLIGGLVMAAISSVALTVKRYKDGEFWIKGCSPEFLASLD